MVVASAGTGVLLGTTDVAVVLVLGGLLALGASALVWDTRRIRPIAVDDESPIGARGPPACGRAARSRRSGRRDCSSRC